MERDSDRRPILVGRLLNSCFWSANWICGKKSGIFCKKLNRSTPRTQGLEQTPTPPQSRPRAQFLLVMGTGYGKLPILFNFSPCSQDQRCHSRLLNSGSTDGWRTQVFRSTQQNNTRSGAATGRENPHQTQVTARAVPGLTPGSQRDGGFAHTPGFMFLL